MKATELRIGNYVMYDNEIKKLYLGRDIDDYITDLNPIPITEDWLLKFGFEKHKKYDNYKIKLPRTYLKIFIYIDKKTNKINNISYGITGSGLHTQIKHIHQLQNLYFALTNKELKQ